MNKNFKQLSASQIEDAIRNMLKIMLERDYIVELNDIEFAPQKSLEDTELVERVKIFLTISRNKFSD